MKKFFVSIVLLIMTPFLLTSCFGTDIPDTAGDKLTVTASFYAMYDFARLIGGDKAEVYNLSEDGGEPHEFEPSAADMVKTEKSDIFIYNSDTMEGWVGKIIGSMGNNVTVIKASEGMETGDNDPHVWLDPKNAYTQMEKICDAFCEKDSANADYYRENLRICREKTEQLDRDYAESGLAGKKIIVSHEAYGYLCRAYGIEQMGLNGINDESEASPARIAEIIEFMKANGIKYVYAENTESDKIVRTVAEGAGAEVLVLSPFESETGGRNYFEVMRDNLDALVK
ncbi:MAG: zinc ABC transporter substrate-binding protein [Oscillospiraceae bacterium]|nr:zinc ABC transporter substrate-binding protein [Oscillospiraceae bacterium]